MGRHRRALALGIGKASAPHSRLIPEEYQGQKIRFSAIVDTLVGAIVKRLSYGRRDGVAIIAEGLVLELDAEDLKGIGQRRTRRHGHVRIAE